MECKYQELLEQHRSKFNLVVDVERLFPVLQSAEALSTLDIDTINKHTTKSAKVDELLDILVTKDNLAFKSLCYALETTYPHLLTVMFLGNGQRLGTNISGSLSLSVTSDSEEEILRRSHSSGDTRSQDSKADTYTRIIPSYEYDFQETLNSLEGKYPGNHGDHINHRHLVHHKTGRSPDGFHVEHTASRDYDWLKSQCEGAMSELQSIKQQQAGNNKRYEAVLQESDSFRQSYKSTLHQLQQSREDINVIKSQNADLLAENKRMEQELKNLHNMRDEDKKEMGELRKHQRENIMSETGSNEVLNALDMYDSIKQDYDAIRERYSDLVIQHSALVTRLDGTRDENTKLKKQYESVCVERDSAILERNGLKQQCTAAIRKWDEALHEKNVCNEKLNKVSQQLANVTQQRDELMKDMSQVNIGQLHAKKELEKAKKAHEAVFHEYTLVMSERDQVHKEIEQLQEKLINESKQIDTLTKDRKSAQDEAETLKREIQSALQHRDKSAKERKELNDKLAESLAKVGTVEQQREEYRKDYEMAIHERDIARRERQEALQDRDRILRDKYDRDQAQKDKLDRMDITSKESDLLKKQLDKLQQELLDGVHEADIAKNRRDWAFGERDKIVHERDSIRTLCDNLRRDRDRAVSDLAQALRDYDEMKKEKYEVVKELKELREKCEVTNEKELRKSQLNSVGHNQSRDSAIDADLQEWETETLNIQLDGSNKDDLGFDLVGGKDDPKFPNDNSIFVSHVIKGSPADGKLKVNDQLLRINSSDVGNVDKRFARGVLRSCSSNMVNMQVLRRRKASPSRSWQAVQLNIPPGKDLGLQVDNGLYISRINPGSYSAKEGVLTIGDRIISVNGRSIENMTPDELLKLLYQCSHDAITLDVWRNTSPLNSNGSSPLPTPPHLHTIPCSADTPLLALSMKCESQRTWESMSDSSKGSSRNMKVSGSQTDSLDSEGASRRHRKSVDNKEIDQKGRHSVHLIDKALEKVDKMFRTRHKSQERHEPEEKARLPLSVYAHNVTTNDEDVLGEFDFPVHKRENSGSSRSSNRSRKREFDSEFSGTGTWPKCVRMCNTTDPNGTVVLPQPTRKRPTLDGIINRPSDFIPTAKVPPMPPERMSSYVAVRHTPQNSDSTITYNSRPASPLSPLQPTISPHYPKSPINRRSYIPDTSTSPRDQITRSQPQEHVHNQYHTQAQNQGHGHRAKVNNTRNPPRMPHIQSSVPAAQFQLEPVRTGDRQVTPHRPQSTPRSRDHKPYNNYLSPSQSNSVSDYTQDVRQLMGGNSTPEQLSASPLPTPSRFTDRPPGGRPYPKPSTIPHSTPSSCLPTPSQPVMAKQHNVQQATTTVLPPFPAGSLRDSITELERLPPYHSSPDWHSSPSPSVDRYTPTPSEAYTYSCLPGASPGPRLDHETTRRTYGEKTDRIRIPSTPSVLSNDRSGSVEVVSDGSPCSPFPDINIGKMLPPTSPHAESGPNRNKPQPGETRRMNIEKTSKLIGFQIEMGPSGGIFVSSVNENSLAAQAGLMIGDQLLEICAINMRNATYDLAARVLQQSGNNVTMLVQYNPEKYNDQSGSSGESSTNTSPIHSPNSTLKRRHLGDLPKSPHRSSSHHSHSSPGGKCEPPRKISFKKANPSANLGISLTGGNAVGIFVHDVQQDSPAAAGPHGLHCGDQILEYNGVDFMRATFEQAYRQIHQPCSSVRIKVRYHPSMYHKARSRKGGDCFYLRAMFDHVGEKEGELSFRKDHILQIDNSMHSGKQGLWYAWLVNDDGDKIKAGTIPSKDRLEDDLVLRRSLSESLSLHDSEEIKTPTRRGSGSARRSFFRRKKHQRNDSKDSRELSSFSDASLNSDSLPVLDDLSLCTYTSIEKLECKSTRPVVLIAPLADALVQKLTSESPDKYYFVEPAVMQTSQHVMEQGLKEGNFVDYWQHDDRYFCIRVTSIHELCDKNVHCLLNVNPLAIERLHRLQIYPIVIYARHKSYKQIKEVKDVQFLPEKLSNKSAKDLYDYCQKKEHEFRHLVSATIQGGNLAEMCQQIKNVIVSEQEKPVWIPTSTIR